MKGEDEAMSDTHSEFYSGDWLHPRAGFKIMFKIGKITCSCLEQDITPKTLIYSASPSSYNSEKLENTAWPESF